MSESTGFVDYYALLGVQTDAEPAVIRVAFIRLAKEHHPDLGGDTADMQQFTLAYRTLMSEKSRKAYDMLHDFHTGNTEVKYHNYGKVEGTAVDNLSDDEIDNFLDTLFTEFSQPQPKPKKDLKTRLREFF